MIKPISLGKPGEIKPMAVLMAPDGAKLYVSTGRGRKVFTIDTATNLVLGKRPFERCFRRGCRNRNGNE